MLDGESVSVEVHGSPEDIKSLDAAHRYSRGLNARLPLLAAAIVFALIVTYGSRALFLYSSLPYPMAATIAAIAGLGLFLVIVNVLGRGRSKKRSDPRGVFLRGFTINAGPEGIDVKSEYFDARFRWPAILRFTETAKHFFLYTDAAQAIIVPKRSFASPGDASRFAIIVRAHTGAG